MVDDIEVRKNKLFEDEPDISKWGIIDPGFMEHNRELLLSDFEFAKKYML